MLTFKLAFTYTILKFGLVNQYLKFVSFSHFDQVFGPFTKIYV